MQNYELTNRGKIIIIVILVLLVFVLPVIVLAVRAWSSSPPPLYDDPPLNTSEESEDTSITNRPLPDGSGFNPPQEPEKSDEGEQGSFDPPPENTEEMDDTPEYGPVSLNRGEGKMTFRFSPDLQDALDSGTLTMLEDFVSLPANTVDSQVMVEIPQLPEEDISLMISAITDAFADNGISLENLAFLTYSTDTDEQSYEIRLSFFTNEAQK